MTISKAKKLLGEDTIYSDDKYLEQIIHCFEKLIEIGIQEFEQKYQGKYGFDTIPKNKR